MFEDFTRFCIKYAGPIILAAASVIGGVYYLGWDLARVVYANDTRSTATERNLADHIKADDEYRRELREAIQRIDDNVAATRESVARLEAQQ